MNYNELKNKYLKHLDISDIDFTVVEILKVKRSSLNNIEFTQDELIKIENVLNRIINNEPLSQIFKKQNFYGRDFIVNQRVLTPRFETEELVYNALKIAKDNNIKTVLDLCCGSGCIGISMKLENQNLDVTLSDISEFALNISKDNARQLNSRVKFIKSDLFEKINDNYQMIVSNPPYIDCEEKTKLDKNVLDYDPHISLFADDEGLHFYKEIEKNIRDFKNLKYLILEIGYSQKEKISEIFKNYNTTFIKDINKIDRILVVKR